MKLAWTALTVPKAGHSAVENEDAFAVAADRAALCDGASEGWASGAWAQHLADALVNSVVTPGDFAAWFTATRAGFKPAVASASWYAETKQADGAFATILGLTFSTARDGSPKYHAVAVGDTALFHVREPKLVAKFPIEASADFGNRPKLVASVGGEPEPEWFAGRAELGDCFYLATDAVAEWLLKSVEQGRSPWAGLNALNTADEFIAWIESQRTKRRLKNDDSTLLRVKIG